MCWWYNATENDLNDVKPAYRGGKSVREGGIIQYNIYTRIQTGCLMCSWYRTKNSGSSDVNPKYTNKKSVVAHRI